MADEVPAFDDIPSFDDLPDAAGAQAPTQQAAVPNFDDIPEFDALPDTPANGRPAPETAVGSAVRSGAHAVIPGAVGLGGMEAGATIGAAVGGPIGAIAGGIIGGVGASMLTRKAQDTGLAAAGYDDSIQLAANAEEHPYASLGGELVGGGLGLSPVATAGKQLVQRGTMAAIGAGFEGGSEYLQGEDISPAKMAIAAAAGAAFPGINRVGEKATNAGRQVGERVIAGRPGRTANPAADQAHVDVGDTDAPVDLEQSSLYAAPDNPQPTTGNPQSAPARSARDYGKDKAPITPENDMLSQGDIAPDTAAALADPNSPPQSSPSGPEASVPSAAGHPDGVGQAQSAQPEAPFQQVAPEPAPTVETPVMTGTARQNPDGSYSSGNGASSIVFPDRAAAAINQSKGKLDLKKMPEPSVEAGFPQPGEPVAAGANDMPEIKGRAAEPTEGQKEAGNYLKGRTQDFGKPMAVETHAGQTRRGTAPDGTPWENVSPYDYGYFNKTVGKDKDHVDFARPAAGDTEHLGDKHFVIDQKNAETGKFDEHKVFAYYKDEAAARDHFAKGFSDGVDRLGGIKEVTRPELVKLLAKASKNAWNKPLSMVEAAADPSRGPSVRLERLGYSKEQIAGLAQHQRAEIFARGYTPEKYAAAGGEYSAPSAPKVAKPAAERAVVKDLIQKLEASGAKDKADAIRALPEDQILAGIAGKRTRKYGVGTGASAGYPVEGLVNSEGKPVTANTKIRAQERSAKHKEVQNWFEESKPPSQMDPAKETNGELLDRIKPGPGRGDLEGWAPTHKPAEWLWAREASKLLKKPTKGAIEKFREAERMLRGAKEDVDNYRGGNRVEADIARSRRGGDEAVAKAEAANVDLGRNNVEDDAIAAIDAKRTPVNNAADIKKAEAGAGKIVDVNDSVLAKVDTKKIDREVNSAAAKRKAEAAALAGKKSATANVPSEERAASPKKDIKIDDNEKARIMADLEKATKRAASRSADRDITAPVEKTAKGGNDLVAMVNRFAGDEAGSIGAGGRQIDMAHVRDSLRAAFKTTEPKTYIAKKSNGVHDDYVRSLSEDLHKINQEDKNHAIGVRQAIEAMPKELDAPMRERLFHARDADSAHVDMPGKQAGKTNIESLPQREQDLYNEHLKPILDQNDQFVANIRAIDPDRMGPDVADHISRIVKGETDKYNVLSNDDPTQPMHSGIGVNADAAKNRRYYALENQATGARHVVSPTDRGLVVWDKFKRQEIKLPDFAFEDGSTLEAGQNKFTMRQATVKEIEANARGLDGGKKPMQYYKDAGMAATVPNLQLGSMARHLAELDRIRKTPEFEKLSTTNRKTAEERGWKESNLPNFKGTFLHPDLKAVFDDYAGHPTNAWRDLNNWVTKALFWMPTAHIANVGTHWFVGRGLDWGNPVAYARLAKTIGPAYKSVVNQDSFQRELRTAGAGTVYGGVLSHDMVGQIGKAFQQDVKKNPAPWNVMARTLGVDLGDMANAIYRFSQHTMWAANDMFLTQRIMELQQKGMDLKPAIYAAEQDIPNYRIPVKVIGAGEKGRMLSEAMQNNSIMSFGRYHYGMMNSYAGIVKGALNKDSTAGDRIEAIGKMMALGLLVTAVYPMLDKLAKVISQNDDASAQRRGPMSIPYHLYKAFGGTEDAMSAARTTMTVPPLLSTVLETFANKDFRGKPVVEPGTMQRAGKGDAGAALKAITQFFEHVARGMVSPLSTLETAVAKNRPGEGAWRGPVRAVVDQAADIKDPSQRAANYERKAPIVNLRNERIRDRQGGSGFIEGGLNKLLK